MRDARTSTHGGWAELWGDGDSLVLLESKTGASRVVRFDAGMVDSEALRGALAELPPTYAIDIVVGADFTVQQLVDAIGVIRGAGWSRLQLLVAMGTREQRRAELVQIGAPHIAIGQPNAQGDLDKAIIRQTIKTATDQLLRCYTSALETSPQLRGTVSIQFLIQNTGVVSNATGSGVSPVVASCVAAVIQRLTFPHPKGGGLVQVNYPFTFRNGY